MKKYYYAILILAVLTVLSVAGFQKSVRVAAKTDAPKEARNEKAIEYLKQTGSYDSLAKAIKDVNPTSPSAINSTFIQHQKLTAINGSAEDFFGASVAISGDTAVVGSYGEEVGSDDNQGSAYVFVRNGANWLVQAKLTVFDGDDDDNFGGSVAISGDTIIIGAVGDDLGVNIDQGSAYIFVRNDTTWSQQEKLVANDGAASDNFGKSVAISGETVVIGAHFDDFGSNFMNQGSAYIFVRNGAVWTQQTKLTANDGATDDYFGNSVAISSNNVIVGAAGDDIGGNTEQGSAYIFVRSGTTWTQQTKFVANDGAAGDYFGNGVDITLTLSGTIAVVGAWRDDIGGNLNQGSAYVFTRPQSGTWAQTQKLTAAVGNNNDGFGVKVSVLPISGGTIVIGAIFSNNNQGAAYIFKRDGAVWTERQKLTGNDGTNGDNFGCSVAISGDTVIVGAYFANIGSHIDEGATYVFDIGTSAFDFDGDGKTDIGIFRPNVGEWWINRSSTGQTFATQFGLSTDKIVPADFTGDGKADIAFFRPSNGQWFILRSEDSSFYAFPFGANGDTPVPADYDGDGKTDAAVFRASTLTWYISKSSGGTDIIGFGAANDKPVIGDYDGDGKADIAIFRNGANGAEWWIRRSSDATVFATQFGLSTDNPTQGDFTGDGKSDIAFFRPSNGNWFVLRSEDFSFYSFPFGAANDIPSAGDYDGDGRIDAGVFRPSNTTWYINRSTAGTLIQQFGQTGDKPLPNAFVP